MTKLRQLHLFFIYLTLLYITLNQSFHSINTINRVSTFYSLKYHLTQTQVLMRASQKTSPYFQNQRFFSLRCGLHAVNNFLGQRAYTQKQFDSICDTLQQQSEQKFQHFFGGDYDISVLIKALHNKNYDIEWHDSRKQFTKKLKDQENRKTLQGYLVNVNMKKFYHKLLGLSGRHWVSVKLTKNDKGEFVYKMDSKHDNIQTLKEGQLIKYLEQQRKAGAQILKVFAIQEKQKQTKKQQQKQESKDKQAQKKEEHDQKSQKEREKEKGSPKARDKV